MDMPTDTFLTTLYTIVDDWIVDDWYQGHAPRLLAGKTGKKPLFSDSEVMTLSLAQHFLWHSTFSGTALAGDRGGARTPALHRPQLPSLFPRLISQGRFNRRVRGLCWLTNALRQHLVERMGLGGAPCLLIDGTPVHLRHWRRFGQGHLLLPEAALGYCAAKKETFYGFRLLALTTPDGVIVDWDLFAASADEREGARELLELLDSRRDSRRRRCVLGDKGFLDRKRQAVLEEDRGLLLLTPKRKNQHTQNAPAWDALMSRARRVIETTFAQAEGTFRRHVQKARSEGTFRRHVQPGEAGGADGVGHPQPGHRQDHWLDPRGQAQPGAGALAAQARRVLVLNRK